MADVTIKTPTSTYDPQVNSFLKRPEIKICPACNQPLPSDVKPFANHMNRYNARSEGAQDVILNSNEDKLTINGVVLYKVKLDAPKEIVTAPTKPVTPITPAKS